MTSKFDAVSIKDARTGGKGIERATVTNEGAD